jgi:nitrogen-specific signal transduction histidine kinase
MTEPSGADETAGAGAAERVARGMLHEIRNVLNPIVSAAWLLQTNADDPVKVRELAARIETFAKAEERVAARMKDLLAKETAADDRPAEGAGVQRSAAPSSITRRTP